MRQAAVQSGARDGQTLPRGPGPSAIWQDPGRGAPPILRPPPPMRERAPCRTGRHTRRPAAPRSTRASSTARSTRATVRTGVSRSALSSSRASGLALVSLMAAALRDLARQDAKYIDTGFSGFRHGSTARARLEGATGNSRRRRHRNERDFQPRRLWRATRCAPSYPEPVGRAPVTIDFDPFPRSVPGKGSRNYSGPTMNTGERIKALSHRSSARHTVSYRVWQGHP